MLGWDFVGFIMCISREMQQLPESRVMVKT